MSSIKTLDKVYMSIPYEEKEWAKEQGFKFDGSGGCWYLPPGKDPLPFKSHWSYLENTYADREELKKRGCRYNKKLKKVYVPASLSYLDFIKWWPESLKQFVFCGRFVVKEFVSKTGQAELYLGWDTVEGEYSAIKYILEDIPGVSTASQRKSFDVELNALLELDQHPNIVKVLDWEFREETKRFCIVSQWVPGGDLSPYIGATKEESAHIILNALQKSGYDLDEGDLKEIIEEIHNDPDEDPWLDEAPILIGILDGLVHAHSKGIYHRDIKPKNILIDFDWDNLDKNGDPRILPKLCDFGSAKRVDLGDPNAVKRSQHTMVSFATKPYRPIFNPHSEEGFKEVRHQYTWDLFAWAVLTIEVLANQSVDDGPEEAVKLLDEKVSMNLDNEIVKLLKAALSTDPDDRPHDLNRFRSKIIQLTEKRKKRLKWKK